MYPQQSVEEGFKLIEARSYNDAIKLFTAIVLKDSSNLEALNGLAQACYGAGDLPRAFQNYELSLNKDPSQSGIWVAYGNLFYNQGNSKKAASSYQQAIKYDSTHVRGLNNLAMVLKDLGNHDEAETYFLKAVYFDSTYSLAMRNLGDIYLKQHKTEKAILWLEKATSADPKSLYGLYWLGRAHVQNNNIQTVSYTHLTLPPILLV